MNYTYILKCKDGTLYTGWTNDLDKRVKAHNEGRGAKYTRSRTPVELVYYETFETKEEAQRRELILSRLVDTFSSRILYPMLLLSGNHSIAVV